MKGNRSRSRFRVASYAGFVLLAGALSACAALQNPSRKPPEGVIKGATKDQVREALMEILHKDGWETEEIFRYRLLITTPSTGVEKFLHGTLRRTRAKRQGLVRLEDTPDGVRILLSSFQILAGDRGVTDARASFAAYRTLRSMIRGVNAALEEKKKAVGDTSKDD